MTVYNSPTTFLLFLFFLKKCYLEFGKLLKYEKLLKQSANKSIAEAVTPSVKSADIQT